MKKLKQAVIIAKRKEQEQKDILFCIEEYVCPECTGNLKCFKREADELLGYSLILPILIIYKCTNPECNFKYTP